MPESHPKWKECKSIRNSTTAVGLFSWSECISCTEMEDRKADFLTCFQEPEEHIERHVNNVTNKGWRAQHEGSIIQGFKCWHHLWDMLWWWWSG